MITTPPEQGWRQSLYVIIFESDTPAGKGFDILLLISILLSVLAVMLDSVASVQAVHGRTLYLVEWFFTVLFSVEYILRLACVRAPLRYAVSFFGIVDLLAVLPTYLSLLLPGSQYLLVIRILRVLRVFRILRLAHHAKEARIIMAALHSSRRKITVFLLTIMTLVVILGSLMYVVEGGTHGFTSIPTSIYWAIVTLTTVGYGDISPETPVGQALASLIMIIGYSIIAVPTGIVSAELVEATRRKPSGKPCPECGRMGHDADARYCKHCSGKLPA